MSAKTRQHHSSLTAKTDQQQADLTVLGVETWQQIAKLEGDSIRRTATSSRSVEKNARTATPPYATTVGETERTTRKDEKETTDTNQQ